MSLPSRRPSLLPLAIALGVVFPAAVAHAVPPSETDFVIRYYSTDEDGNRGSLMTQQDLQQFVNQARCECGQKIEASIQLMPSGSGGSFDQNRVRTFAGNQCANAQTGTNQQNHPCVQLEDQLPNYYTKTPSMFFEPIWLATGIARDSPSQSISDAIPFGSCDAGQGDGGIWICVEDGMQSDCQTNEFIITGTSNANGTSDGMTTAIHYDFDPPTIVPTNYRSSEGDGAVVIEWDFEITGDANGYRVLCANADGSPVDGKGIDAPSVTAQNRGTLYFTAQNLCPDEPFGQGGGAGSDDGGTGGSDGGSTGGSDSGTTGAALGDDYDQGVGFGGLVATGSSTGTGGGTGAGSSTSTGGTSGTSTGTTTGGATTGDDPAAAGLHTLDWAYVCSDHITQNAQRARIDGLDNGQEYLFLVVAYDSAGNPIEASDVLRATPRETTDLWEQCEQQGNVCGDGGFCSCRTEPSPAPAAWWALVLLGLPRRRRR
jgi:MYXO-CTERM domain-containing protein